MTGHGQKYDPRTNYTHYVQQTHHDPETRSAKTLDFHQFTADHSANRLNADASDLGAEVKRIVAPPDAFGISPLGESVRHHAALAHGKLKGAVELLSKAMESYSTAVTTASKTLLDADGNVSTSMSAIKQGFATGNTNAATPTAAAPVVKDAPPPTPDPSGTDSPTANALTTNPAAPFLNQQPLPMFSVSPELQQLINQLQEGN